MEPGISGGYGCSVSRCRMPAATSVGTMDTKSPILDWVLGDIFQRLLVL